MYLISVDPVPIPALIVDGDIQVNVGKLCNISLLFQFWKKEKNYQVFVCVDGIDFVSIC